MPKVVDHEQRRREVLDATWRVILREGAQGTTIRAIAQEMGCSAGVLAHYFKDKDDILTSAHLHAYARAEERIEAVAGQAIGMMALRKVLLEALPLDDVRLDEARIEVIAWNGALSSPKIAAVKQSSLERWRQKLTQLVRSARELGEITTALSDDLVVHEIVVLVDAMSVEAVIHPDYATPQRQLQLTDALLGRLR